MKKRLLSLCALLALATIALFAADVAGKWTSEQAGRNGGAARVTTYEFKVDGTTLTGTVTAAMGRGGEPTPTDISNGKIDGDNISFEVTRTMGQNTMTSKYSGTVSGDEIKMTVDSGRGPRDITLKRSK